MPNPTSTWPDQGLPQLDAGFRMPMHLDVIPIHPRIASRHPLFSQNPEPQHIAILASLPSVPDISGPALGGPPARPAVELLVLPPGGP